MVRTQSSGLVAILRQADPYTGFVGALAFHDRLCFGIERLECSLREFPVFCDSRLAQSEAPQEILYGGPQRPQIPLHGIPDDLSIDALIVVPQDIANARDLLPRESL